MLLWRLSGKQHARSFDGGYGLLFDGRWNTVGQAITYCATSPSLCVLEKLVHVDDPALLPDLVMVTYEAPDALPIEEVTLDQLPGDWRSDETSTQARGDVWHRGPKTPLLQVPSAVVPLASSPDVNVLINHTHPDSSRITLVGAEPFSLDLRLFQSQSHRLNSIFNPAISNPVSSALVIAKCFVQARQDRDGDSNVSLPFGSPAALSSVANSVSCSPSDAVSTSRMLQFSLRGAVDASPSFNTFRAGCLAGDAFAMASGAGSTGKLKSGLGARPPMLLGIIADDFTGASDIANTLAEG